MAKPRFKVSERHHTIKKEGVITLADLQKKFNIPKNATVTVDVPGGWTHPELEMGSEFVHLNVRWEEVK